MIKAQQTYGYQTIGSLIKSLKSLVEENKYLSYDSPVFISDYNMSKQNYKFDILPAFSQEHYTAGVCLFHSLNEPVLEYMEEVEVEPSTEEQEYNMKFTKWFKS